MTRKNKYAKPAVVLSAIALVGIGAAYAFNDSVSGTTSRGRGGAAPTTVAVISPAAPVQNQASAASLKKEEAVQNEGPGPDIRREIFCRGRW